MHGPGICRGVAQRLEVACRPGGFKSSCGFVVPYSAASDARVPRPTHATRSRNGPGEVIPCKYLYKTNHSSADQAAPKGCYLIQRAQFSVESGRIPALRSRRNQAKITDARAPPKRRPSGKGGRFARPAGAGGNAGSFAGLGGTRKSMQYAAAAFHLEGLDFASLLQLVSLVALPFAHEDLAIVLGAYILVNDLMPAGLVVAGLYSGIVASDFALYGIGFGARRLPWLRRHAVDDRVRGFGDALKRNLFALVPLCRFVPGLVFVACVACGWGRVSLARFTVASLLVSALYLPMMLYLVVVLGGGLDGHIGLWAWPFLLAGLGLAAFARGRILAFHGAAGSSEQTAGGPRLNGDGLASLPSLAGLSRRIGPAELIPPLLFKIPLMFP